MRNRLATTAVTLLALCLVFGAPRAAAADTALGTSSWSLEIGSDIGSGESDASFAIRRHSGASSAFRLGIEVFFDKADGDGATTATGFADIDTKRNNESRFAALSIQWMRFASVRDNVTATFAVGPVAEVGRSSVSQGSAFGQPSFTGFESRQTTTRYGLDLGLGVEWFFNRRVSLGGRTGLRSTIGTRDDVSIFRSGTGPTYSKTETNVDSDVTQITIGTGKIQLTGYF